MLFLSIDQLKPGMILATDVTDTNGRLLLSKGQPIAAKHLNIFKMWGVRKCRSKTRTGTNLTHTPTLDPEAMRRVAESLKPAFSDNDLTHPAVAEIFRQAVVHRSRRIADHPVQARLNRSAPPASLSGTDMRKKIRSRDIKLPEIPSIIFTLNDTIADPFSSADDIAQVISKSPGLIRLAAADRQQCILRFSITDRQRYPCGHHHRIKEVSALAVGITTMEVFKDIPKPVFDMQAFTHHSLACGVLARILAAGGNIRNTEQLFVSGLLHDIGRMVMFKYFPQQAGWMLSGLPMASPPSMTWKSGHGHFGTPISPQTFSKNGSFP
jgi:hypothetical protein